MTRKLLFIAALLLCGVSVAALPRIQWLKSTHNFGAFNEDLRTVSCTFKGINKGDETLVIYSVKPNCGCTTTGNYAGKEYAPGDTITIEATYDASGRPGRFTKKVLVTTNADPAKHTLVLLGTVIGSAATLVQRYPMDHGPIRLHTDNLLFGEIKKGRTAKGFINGYNQTADTIEPTIIDAPQYFNVIVEPRKVKPGEQFVISLNHHTGNDSRWGLHGDTIRVLPMRAGETPETTTAEPFPITTVVTMTEDFNSLTDEQRANAPTLIVNEPTIDLKRISLDSSGTLTERVRLTNQGKRDLLIRSVSCANPAVTLENVPRRVKPGKSAEITVTIDTEKLRGAELLDARILIIANDPANPSTIVRVVGEIL